MKNRLLTGWTLRRGIYLAMGVMILVQAFEEKQWMLSIFGLYFAVMGIFALGCAGSNCQTYSSYEKKHPSTIPEKVEFEELK